MSNPLNQLDLFGLPAPAPAPATPKPTISGLHWYAPDGTPLVKTIDWRGEPRVIPVRYVFEGVAWSGRGRMPPSYQAAFKTREEAFKRVEAQMIKRGYQRVEVQS